MSTLRIRNTLGHFFPGSFELLSPAADLSSFMCKAAVTAGKCYTLHGKYILAAPE